VFVCVRECVFEEEEEGENAHVRTHLLCPRHDVCVCVCVCVVVCMRESVWVCERGSASWADAATFAAAMVCV